MLAAPPKEAPPTKTLDASVSLELVDGALEAREKRPDLARGRLGEPESAQVEDEHSEAGAAQRAGIRDPAADRRAIRGQGRFPCCRRREAPSSRTPSGARNEPVVTLPPCPGPARSAPSGSAACPGGGKRRRARLPAAAHDGDGEQRARHAAAARTSGAGGSRSGRCSRISSARRIRSSMSSCSAWM